MIPAAPADLAHDLLPLLRDGGGWVWQDTGRLLASATCAERRAWICAVARSVLGLGGADRPGEPAGRAEAFRSLLAPGEPRDLSDTSTCGLVVRAIWRLAGVRHPALDAPYRAGMAVADVVTIGRLSGASVRVPRDQALVRPGVVLRIGGLRSEGESGEYGGPTHVLTVVGVDGPSVASIDGGQREAPIVGRWRTQHVAMRTRDLVLAPDGLWLRGSRYELGRMIREAIDCARLPFAEGVSAIVATRTEGR